MASRSERFLHRSTLLEGRSRWRPRDDATRTLPQGSVCWVPPAGRCIVLPNPRQQEVYRLIDELYREGTATYVGNIGSFPANTPFIQDMREPAMKNADRMADNFILLETLIYRMAHDPHSHFEEVRSLGFD